MASRVVELLRSMDLFAELSQDDLGRVADVLKEHKFAENDRVFAQGEPGDGLYIVLNGRIRISAVDGQNNERVLAFYGPGEFFGDMAVLTGEPRSATARASTSARLLHLRKDDFDTLAATSTGILRGMLRVLVERQTAMNTRLAREFGVAQGDGRGQVTVVFSPRGGAGLTVLATNLAVALAQCTPDRVAILDLDLLFGHVAILLDLVPTRALSAMSPSAIQGLDRENLAHYLTEHPESSLRMMAGSLRPEDSEVVTADHVQAILGVLRRHFVQVVVDGGSRFSEPCLAAMELADRVLVVTTPEPTAVFAARESQRVLREVLKVPANRISFVQDRPTPYGNLSCEELATALGTSRVSEIPFGGEEVSQASLTGLPLVMSHPANPTSRAIAALAHELEQSAAELTALTAG